jgi:aminoglycoside 3-N-acetyltransferase I
VQTRRLTVDDRQLARRAFVMMTRVFGDDGEPLSDDYLQEILSRPDLWAVVAVSGDEPVGAVTAHMLPMTRAHTAELFVYDLAVRPDWQRRGRSPARGCRRCRPVRRPTRPSLGQPR